MSQNIKNFSFAFKSVFSKPKYTSIALAFALFFYVANVFIQNYKTIKFFLVNEGFFQALNITSTLVFVFRETITTSSFITLVTISILFGILISLLIFKLIAVKSGKGIGVLGSIGIILGVLAPGCAACGVGLLALLGIGAGFLSFLPFNGLEISLLAILMLGFSVYKISIDLLECGSCKIQLKNERRSNERRNKKNN